MRVWTERSFWIANNCVAGENGKQGINISVFFSFARMEPISLFVALLLVMIAASVSANRRCPNLWLASFRAAAMSTAIITITFVVLSAEALRPLDSGGLVIFGAGFVCVTFASWVVALFVGHIYADCREPTPNEQHDTLGSSNLKRVIPRFTIAQLLMATAFVGIVLSLMLSSGYVHHGAYIESMGFLADGEKLAVVKLNAPHPILRSSSGGKFARTVSILHTGSGAMKSIASRIVRGGRFGRGAFSEHGRSSLATLPAHDLLFLKDFGIGTEVTVESPSKLSSARAITVLDGVSSMALSSDGSLMAVSHFDDLSILDIATGMAISKLSNPKHSVWYGAAPMSFSDDNSLLATGGEGGADVWEVATHTIRASIDYKESDVVCPVQFVPNRSLLAVGNGKGVELYDMQNQLVDSFPLVTSCRAIAVSSCGKHLAAASDRGVALFDIDLRDQVRIWPWDDPACLAFSPDGTQLAVGDFNGDVALLDTVSGKELWRVSPPSAEHWGWAAPYVMLGLWVVACIVLARRKSSESLTRTE